jgi:protein phosphatase
VTRRADALRGGDLFLLCSDGVSGMVAPDELRAALLASAGLDTTGAALIQRALDAGGKDNASALLVRVLDD